MAFADTSTSTLAYAIESTFNVAPTGAATYKLLRNTGESMNSTLESAKSEEIDADRQFTGSVHVSGSSAGAVNYQLSYAEYDDFLAAVLQSADWTAGYSDTGISVASRVITVSSTTGLKVGHIVKLSGGVTAEDGIYTVEAVTTATTFRVVEPITDEGTSTIAITNNGTIENGSNQRSFTFEKDFKVGGVSNYFSFSGMTCGSMSMSMSTGSIMSGDFNFTGATPSHSATSLDSGTYIPATTNELMNAVNNVQGLSLTAVAADGTQTAIAGTTFQELSVSVDNSLREQKQIGNLYAAGIGSSRIMVESSATLYFANREFLTQFLANGSVQLRFRLGDNLGNTYGVVLPEVKISSHEVTASGPDADIMAAVSFSGIKDTRSGTAKTIMISKINAV